MLVYPVLLLKDWFQDFKSRAELPGSFLLRAVVQSSNKSI